MRHGPAGATSCDHVLRPPSTSSAKSLCRLSTACSVIDSETPLPTALPGAPRSFHVRVLLLSTSYSSRAQRTTKTSSGAAPLRRPSCQPSASFERFPATYPKIRQGVHDACQAPGQHLDHDHASQVQTGRTSRRSCDLTENVISCDVIRPHIDQVHCLRSIILQPVTLLTSKTKTNHLENKRTEHAGLLPHGNKQNLQGKKAQNAEKKGKAASVAAVAEPIAPMPNVLLYSCGETYHFFHSNPVAPRRSYKTLPQRVHNLRHCVYHDVFKNALNAW